MVDDLNPVLTFTRREVESLLHFVDEEPDPSQVRLQSHDSLESVLRRALHLYPQLITKVAGQRTHCLMPFVMTCGPPCIPLLHHSLWSCKA